MKQYNRVYARIDLDHFHHNLNAMHANIDPDTKMIGVIKTDGYGHGAVELADEMEPLDYVWGFATATVEEAMELRLHGIRKPILILGYTFPEQYDLIVQYELRPAVFTTEMAEAFSKEAAKQNKDVAVHIKLDTGMGRIGFAVTEENAKKIAAIAKMDHILIEGLFTHFAKADEFDKKATAIQMEKYEQMNRMLLELGVEIPLHHCSNSAGIVDLPQVNLDLVRAGITLYGLWPSDEVIKENVDLKPLLSLHSKVVYVKEVPAGFAISYGGTYVTDRPSTIATIPVGYGDGYPRGLSNQGYVLIHGQKAPIRGRVCMDQFMVDVTEIADVKTGDEVVLIGTQGEQEITMEELGDLSGRFNYEFACDLGKRIPRVYVKNGEVVKTRDYFLSWHD